MAEPLLKIEGLRIEATAYPPGEPPRDVVLVQDVSFALEKGKVLGLIGESGAGKSTIGLSSMSYGRGGVRLTGGTQRPSGNCTSMAVAFSASGCRDAGMYTTARMGWGAYTVSRGAPGAIAPNETLIFTVDLMDVR